MFWRLKIPARQYSLLFSPQISARQVCQGPLCLSCPAGATRGLFNVFFAPQWISSCLKENTYTLLKVVSLLWVVETVNMIIINHRTIENVTLGPSAWNWTGLSPHKVLFSLPHPGKSTCFHQWKSGPFLTSPSTPHMLSATISWLSYSLSPRRHFVSPSPLPPWPLHHPPHWSNLCCCLTYCTASSSSKHDLGSITIWKALFHACPHVSLPLDWWHITPQVFVISSRCQNLLTSWLCSSLP